MQASQFEAFDSWRGSNAGTFAELGISEVDLSRKMRLLQLAYLCSRARTLSFAQIAASLSVTEDEVEMWMIDVIRAGLVEAKVDQVNAVVQVTRSTNATFNSSQWSDLRTRLLQWKKNITHCQGVLATTKQQINEMSIGR